MRALIVAMRWEVILLLIGYAAVMLWKLLQTASFAGLLRSSDGTISPGRIQLLVLTVVTAMQYLLSTMHDPTQLPKLPSNLIAALAGSQGIYLGAKAWSMFSQIKNKGAK
jgi:hypothetical protein